MDLHKVLLFILATIVSLGGQFSTLTEQFLHLKDLLLHYVWLILHKFLPKRRFVLDRLPRHVAFSVADYYSKNDESALSFPDLARLVLWCGRYGVEKVSIYDWRGIVANPINTKILSDLVWDDITDQETGLDGLQLSVNGVPYSKAEGKSKNGTSTRTLELRTLDWKSGQRAIIQASRNVGTDVKAGKLDASSINVRDMGVALIEYLTSECGVSAPDLLIEFGGCDVGDSTCGFPPLALRIVEIVRVPRHRGVDELTFLECLEKYSQRDRRFGK